MSKQTLPRFNGPRHFTPAYIIQITKVGTEAWMAIAECDGDEGLIWERDDAEERCAELNGDDDGFRYRVIEVTQ